MGTLRGGCAVVGGHGRSEAIQVVRAGGLRRQRLTDAVAVGKQNAGRLQVGNGLLERNPGTSKRPEVYVGIHDRGLGLDRVVVARRIILLRHLQGRLGDTKPASPKSSEENRIRRTQAPRKVWHGENRSIKSNCSLGKLPQDRNRELRPAAYGLIQKQS